MESGQNLEGLVLDRARLFAEEQLVLLSLLMDKPITSVLEADFAALSFQERYAKAILLLSDYVHDRDKTKLEQATIILDSMSKSREEEISVGSALAYTQALDHRYLEAGFALREKSRILMERGENSPQINDPYLEDLIAKSQLELERKKAGLDFEPKESYILLDEGNVEDIEKVLRDFEGSEVVLVVDDLNHLPGIKERFKDYLYTIETESEVHETFSPTSSSRLRVVLKNSNNGIREKGQEFGRAQAKQKDPTKVYVIEQFDESDFCEETPSPGCDLLADSTVPVLDSAPKIQVAFVCTTKENTHGVPVVMNNIAHQLQLDPRYQISYITNSFDNQEIKYTDSEGQEHVFQNRKKFLEFVQEQRIRIDILHTHTWHLSNHYKPFHTERDEMDLGSFLTQLGSPKLIYTEHANPTEDLRRIKARHGIDYAALSRREKIAFLRGNNSDQYPQEQWQQSWEATSILSRWQLMELADAITFVSATQMQEDRTLIPGADYQPKSRVIMNGVDLAKYGRAQIDPLISALHQELGVNGNERVILYAGRMDEEKGIYDLAQAAEILSRTGENITVIYQSGSEPSGEVLGRITSLSPHVRSLFPAKIGKEQREKMAAMYALAEVVVQPTWGECFNQIAAEALAMGTPVVVSNFSAPGEIYVRNGAAFGCRVRDPENLAESLYSALTDQERVKETVGAGQRLIREKLNVEAMAAGYKQLYQDLMRN